MTTCPFCTSSLPVNAATCPTCGASLTSPALEIGAVIGDQYEVERVLGQGGFGITYLALDTELAHRVAIKELFPDGSTRRDGNVIPPQGMDFTQTKQKFLEEAQTVQRFNNDGIVRVYGVFEGNQTAYMVMEALNGSTLTAKVMKDGAIPPKKVLKLARQLGAALEIVHKANLLHRDIKPDNVFLTSDGRVVLIDFGSARGFAQGQVKRLTRLVTPGYAAPEQYASQAAFGTYTDVYGLAATLYFAVEGQMPPMATDLMLGARLEFLNAGQLQSGLEAGLKVKVDERPQTVRDLLELLERPVVMPRAGAMASARVPAITALLYDQHGISISATEIIVQGKAFPASSLEGFELATITGQKHRNAVIEKIVTWSASSALYAFLLAMISAIIAILLPIAFRNFDLKLAANFSFGLFTFFMSVTAVTGVSAILLNGLSFFMIPYFEAKFLLVLNVNQVRRFREFALYETESLYESTQLEQALLKVIPKLP